MWCWIKSPNQQGSVSNLWKWKKLRDYHPLVVKAIYASNVQLTTGVDDAEIIMVVGGTGFSKFLAWDQERTTPFAMAIRGHDLESGFWLAIWHKKTHRVQSHFSSRQVVKTYEKAVKWVTEFESFTLTPPLAHKHLIEKFSSWPFFYCSHLLLFHKKLDKMSSWGFTQTMKICKLMKKKSPASPCNLLLIRFQIRLSARGLFSISAWHWPLMPEQILKTET